MEIKVNKEIRSYQETVYFGLTLRQLICSVLAVAIAVGLYFLLQKVLDRETVGWVCILGAAPVAAARTGTPYVLRHRLRQSKQL